MNTNVLTLETVSLMWKDGLEKVNAERKATGMPREVYFRKLEAVVQGIKGHLKQHGIGGLREVVVKHGEGGVITIVDFDGIAVRPDDNDPEQPFFFIPATRKDSP